MDFCAVSDTAYDGVLFVALFRYRSQHRHGWSLWRVLALFSKYWLANWRLPSINSLLRQPGKTSTMSTVAIEKRDVINLLGIFVFKPVIVHIEYIRREYLLDNIWKSQYLWSILSVFDVGRWPSTIFFYFSPKFLNEDNQIQVSRRNVINS